MFAEEESEDIPPPDPGLNEADEWNDRQPGDNSEGSSPNQTEPPASDGTGIQENQDNTSSGESGENTDDHSNSNESNKGENSEASSPNKDAENGENSRTDNENKAGNQDKGNEKDENSTGTKEDKEINDEADNQWESTPYGWNEDGYPNHVLNPNLILEKDYLYSGENKKEAGSNTDEDSLGFHSPEDVLKGVSKAGQGGSEFVIEMDKAITPDASINKTAAGRSYLNMTIGAVAPAFSDDVGGVVDGADYLSSSYLTGKEWNQFRTGKEFRMFTPRTVNPKNPFQKAKDFVSKSWDNASKFTKALKIGGGFLGAVSTGLEVNGLVDAFQEGDGLGIAEHSFGTIGSIAGTIAPFTGPAAPAVGAIYVVCTGISLAIRYRKQIGEALNWTRDKYGDLAEWSYDKAGQFTETAANAVGNVGEKAANAVGNGVKGAGEAASNAIDKVGSVASNINPPVVGEGLDQAASSVAEGTEKVSEAAGDAIQKTGETISNGVKSAGEKAGNAIKDLGKGFNNFVSP